VKHGVNFIEHYVGAIIYFYIYPIRWLNLCLSRERNCFWSFGRDVDGAK